MSLLPRHRLARCAAAAWALVCAASLAAFFLHPAAVTGGRAALAPLVPLYLAGLPASHLGVAVVGEMRLRLYLDGGTLDVTTEGLMLWGLLSALGYLQWFALLPAVVRGIQRLLARWLSPVR